MVRISNNHCDLLLVWDWNKQRRPPSKQTQINIVGYYIRRPSSGCYCCKCWCRCSCHGFCPPSTLNIWHSCSVYIHSPQHVVAFTSRILIHCTRTFPTDMSATSSGLLRIWPGVFAHCQSGHPWSTRHPAQWQTLPLEDLRITTRDLRLSDDSGTIRKRKTLRQCSIVLVLLSSVRSCLVEYTVLLVLLLTLTIGQKGLGNVLCGRWPAAKRMWRRTLTRLDQSLAIGGIGCSCLVHFAVHIGEGLYCVTLSYVLYTNCF